MEKQIHVNRKQRCIDRHKQKRAVRDQVIGRRWRIDSKATEKQQRIKESGKEEKIEY